MLLHSRQPNQQRKHGYSSISSRSPIFSPVHYAHQQNQHCAGFGVGEDESTGVDHLQTIQEDDRKKKMMQTAGQWGSSFMATGFSKFTLPSWFMMVFKIIISLIHNIGAIVVLIVLLDISLTKDHMTSLRLIQQSYLTTVHSVGVQVALDSGIYTSALSGSSSPVSFEDKTIQGQEGNAHERVLQMADSSSILRHMQPVAIRYQETAPATIVPSLCSRMPATDSKPAVSHATAMDLASWRVCRFQDVPVPFVDVASPKNSVIPFSSNNFLFLLYVTLSITGILAVAFIPPARWDRYNFAVIIALVLTFLNLVAVIAAPSMQRHVDEGDLWINNAFQLPINNVILAVVLYLTVGLVIIHLSRNGGGMVVRNIMSSRHTGMDALKINTKNAIFHFSNYVGTYKDWQQPLSRSSIMGRSSINVWKFQGRLWTQSSIAATPSKYSKNLQGRFSLGAPKEEMQDMSRYDKVHDDGSKKRQVVPVSDSDMFQFFRKLDASSIDTDFIETMEDQMTWITLKYFEYSLTAGLFLVGILLLFKPHAETYIYQTAYVGLFACNIAAIPLHLIFVHACKARDFMECMGHIPFSSAASPAKEMSPNPPVADSPDTAESNPPSPLLVPAYVEKNPTVLEAHRHCMYSVLAYLVASCLFFVAGMFPFIDAVSETNSLEGVPDVIKASTFMTLGLFFAFTFSGIGFIAMLLWNLSRDRKDVKKWIFLMNLTFEIINNVKWLLAFIICFGGLSSIGFL